MQSQNLTPEFERALRKLHDSACDLPLPVEHLRENFWITNQIITTVRHSASRMLPSGDQWMWNQSKSKRIITQRDCVITIRKLIPRRHEARDGFIVPSYKLWEFKIENYNGGIQIVYWCEKGRTKTEAELTLEKEMKELNLADFSFLGEFMEPETAQEFWPS